MLKESQEFINTVIQKKYCHNNENSWEDVVKRFEEGLPKDSIIPQRMREKKFIPAGSVLAGFNITNSSSMSNCYFIPIEEDSIEGIFEFGKKQCRTYSWRGGVGTDISILRPKDAPVKNAAKTSSGSVSFMPILSLNTNTIGQNGRRGAFMISISDWHPDVLDFIISKTQSEKVFDTDYINNFTPNIYYANISVKLSDDFFKAVDTNSTWDLKFPVVDENYTANWNGDLADWQGNTKVYKTIKATDMLKSIAKAAWAGAEPGVLYWDTVVNKTPLGKLKEYKPRGVNPCGEEPLGNYQSCNLNAITLYKYVKNPFTETAEFDWESLKQDLFYYLEFANLIIDRNEHPLSTQNRVDRYLRKVGLEFTGLADMLAMLNLKYDSSAPYVEALFTKIDEELIKANIKLAKRDGCAEVFNNDDNFNKFITALPENLFKASPELKEDLYKYRLRNSAWTTVGPTGSVSIIADNCSSGIEPVFKLSYTRRSRLLGKDTRLVHLPLMQWLVKNRPEDLNLSDEELKRKYHYQEATEIGWLARLKMQAAIQRHITDSISSTINLPESATPDDIYQIYFTGWKLGLKGITVYREGSLKGILAETEKTTEKTTEATPEKTTEKTTEKTSEATITKKALLPDEPANRHIVSWQGIKVYVNVVYDKDSKKPLEVFTQLPIEAGWDKDGIFNKDNYLEKLSYWHTISRLLSLLLRYDIPLPEILKQLNKSSYSMTYLPAILTRILSKYNKAKSNYMLCPACGANQLIKEGGCERCLSCGYSKCE